MAKFARDSVVTPAMVGQWEKNARIVVCWRHPTTLSVKAAVRTERSVPGPSGATLIKLFAQDADN